MSRTSRNVADAECETDTTSTDRPAPAARCWVHVKARLLFVPRTNILVKREDPRRTEELSVARKTEGRVGAMYICRGCGAEIAYPDRFVKCPVCGIRL